MSFEISCPIQFLSQPTFMKEDTYDAMGIAHFKQQQNRSSAYNKDTTDKSSLGTEGDYADFAPSSPHSSPSSYYHTPSSAIPVSASLAATQTASNQFDSYSTDLDLSISPLSSSPPPRKKDSYLQQQQNGLLSPLPTNTSMYEPHFAQNTGTDIKISTPPITDMIHPQQYMMWKQDLYSPPLAATNTSWTQSQQEEDVFGPTAATTPTPRSLSGSPSLHYRDNMVSSNMPPCNCIPMIQYDPMYNHPETLLVPYQDPSALTLASSASPPTPGTGMYSDLANNNSKLMGYSHQSQQRLSMDQSYQHPFDLSPSSSSSLSDDYSQHLHHHHQQRHSMNNNIDNHIGTNPLTSSSSSSSSNTGKTAASSTASTPRRYKCTVCVKRFTRPSSLATHMHSHTGEVN